MTDPRQGPTAPPHSKRQRERVSPTSTTAARLGECRLHTDDSVTEAIELSAAGVRWLRVSWSLHRKTLDRAISAMGHQAHRAVPVIRLHHIETSDTSPRSSEQIQEEEISADAQEWFLHVPHVTGGWVAEVGYRFGKDRFFSLIHSVPLDASTLAANAPHSPTELQEPPRRRLDGQAPPPLKAQGHFHLEGATRPGARLTINDQAIEVHPRSGEFHWEIALTNGRVVFPILAEDMGTPQRALLALELNLNILAPEEGDGD